MLCRRTGIRAPAMARRAESARRTRQAMEGFPINIGDIGIAVIIVISGLLALVRGFVREVLSVAAWVGAAFATLYTFRDLRPVAREFIAITWLADATTGAVVFVLSLIVFSVFSYALASRVHHSDFRPLDKSLGLLFGLLRGAVVVCLLFMVVDWALPRDQFPRWIAEARARPLVEEGARMIERLLPRDMRRRGRKAAESAEDAAKRAIEVERAVRVLSDPPPKADAPAASPGYKEQERKEMDRLIQGNQ